MPTSEIGDAERISRFARHKTEYSLIADRVYHSLFLPPSSLRLSVFWSTEIADEDLWRIGDEVVFKGLGRVMARGDVIVAAIRDSGLQLEPDPEVHPKHANVVGWPVDKAKRIRIAKTLAGKAKLIARQTE